MHQLPKTKVKEGMWDFSETILLNIKNIQQNIYNITNDAIYQISQEILSTYIFPR